MDLLLFLSTDMGRFVLGIVGAVCYFIITATGFIKTSVDDPKHNPNVFKIPAIVFFALVGGLLPLLFDIRSPLGCFVQGLTIKPTLTYLYQGAKRG